ncbi:MAG TPA: DUF4129 domain-containing protein [Actinomycetota bacterium]|nr:DUF4129 domain-containing protein [Actinomycetota bacterium]
MVAVVLVALVAVGSLRGPLGSGRGRPSYPADLIDSLLLLLFLAMVATAVLAAVSLWPGRNLARARRRAGGSWNLILPMAAVLLLWLFRDLLALGGDDRDQVPTTTIPSVTTLEAPGGPTPESGVVPLIVAGVALAAMIAIVVAQLAADRRRRRPPKTPGERLVELLDDTLEDLEREPDPRRAVIGAWARMEAGLAAAGLPRHPSEAPFEYAARVLESALARPDSVHRLTGLFERAKFSHHDIGQADRDQAIAALRAVRQELAEAVERAAQAEAAAKARASADGDPEAGTRAEDDPTARVPAEGQPGTYRGDGR